MKVLKGFKFKGSLIIITYDGILQTFYLYKIAENVISIFNMNTEYILFFLF